MDISVGFAETRRPGPQGFEKIRSFLHFMTAGNAAR